MKNLSTILSKLIKEKVCNFTLNLLSLEKLVNETKRCKDCQKKKQQLVKSVKPTIGLVLNQVNSFELLLNLQAKERNNH